MTRGERLLRLLKTCASDDGRLEMGMRDWAADDAAARNDTLRIDDRRIDYMTQLTIEAGVSPAAARRAIPRGLCGMAWILRWCSRLKREQTGRYGCAV